MAKVLQNFLVVVALLTARVIVEAQDKGKIPRIGFLGNSTAAGSTEQLDAFRQQLVQLNWIEAKNLTIEYRYAEGKGLDRLVEISCRIP